MSAYDVGASLQLDLLEVNDQGSLDTSSAQVRCEIVHAYTPFTLSVVVRARVLEDTPILLAGSIVILKILDRKYCVSQGRKRRGHEWTDYREHLARQLWQAIAAGSLQDDFDEDVDFDDWDEAWIEEHYHRSTAVCRARITYSLQTSSMALQSQKWFSTEREAYNRLADLQGKHIPRLYHIIRAADSSPGQSIPLDTAHLAYGYILEYLEGAVTAADLSDPAIFPNLRDHTRNIMSAMSSFRNLGVVHLDVRSGNLLFASDGAMIIDFGHAVFPSDGQSDEEWNEYALSKNKVETTRSILHYRGLRPRSPIPIDDGGVDHINRKIHAQPPEWIDRWYTCLYDVKAREEMVKLPYSSESPWFIKKDGIEAWEATKQETYEGFQLPRPGSPDWSGLPLKSD